MVSMKIEIDFDGLLRVLLALAIIIALCSIWTKNSTT